MTIYYKATNLDGKDFYSGTVDYAGALESGKRVRVRTETRKSYSCCSGDVLHAADVPTETLIGGRWPCRLFEVSGRAVAQEGHKYGFRSLKVEREIEAHLALGPQGREIADLINRCLGITYPEAQNLAAARDAARGAAWAAAWDAARGAAWDAARDAASALVVHDKLEPRHYDELTGPWRKVIGPIHPDDAALR